MSGSQNAPPLLPIPDDVWNAGQAGIRSQVSALSAGLPVPLVPDWAGHVI